MITLDSLLGDRVLPIWAQVRASELESRRTGAGLPKLNAPAGASPTMARDSAESRSSLSYVNGVGNRKRSESDQALDASLKNMAQEVSANYLESVYNNAKGTHVPG